MFTFALRFMKMKRISEKLRYYLFWNGSIRIFLEGYLDYTMLALMNLREMFWLEGVAIVSISNYFAIFMASLSFLLPFFFFIFLFKNVSNFEDPIF